MNGLDVHLRSQGQGKARTCAVTSVVKVHEAVQKFKLVYYERGVTVKKSCRANMDHFSICSSCFTYCK